MRAPSMPLCWQWHEAWAVSAICQHKLSPRAGHGSQVPASGRGPWFIWGSHYGAPRSHLWGFEFISYVRKAVNYASQTGHSAVWPHINRGLHMWVGSNHVQKRFAQVLRILLHYRMERQNMNIVRQSWEKNMFHKAKPTLHIPAEVILLVGIPSAQDYLSLFLWWAIPASPGWSLLIHSGWLFGCILGFGLQLFYSELSHLFS